MNTSKVKRKLTTILCADVRGYSSLMGVDETDTLQRLQRYRAIMDNLFARHDGRKVNTWGDAVIAEFASVIEAVRCGVEIQDAIGAENSNLPPERQMWFRIGINLGDVMQDGLDLYGDGVNVASRLESLADPGGIMVSETVYSLTHKQLSFAYDYAGEQVVKGLDHPITGYKVRMPGANQPAEEAASDKLALATSAVHGKRGRLDEWRSWYTGLPRSVRVAVSMIALFLTINIVVSGFSDLWFIYPSLPFAGFLVFRLLMGQKESRRS